MTPSGYRFELGALPTQDREPILTAAFAIQLARYSGQSTVPLLTCQIDSTGQPVSPVFSEILIGDETGRAIAGWVSASLLDRRNGEFQNAGSRKPGAAIAWVDPNLGLPVNPGGWGTIVADLVLVVPRTGSSREAWIVADADLFEPAAIGRFARQFEVLVTGLMGDPDLRAADLPILPPEEADLLRSLGTGPRAAPPVEPVHRSFERRASTHPDQPAVRYREEVVSYGELNRRANRLAHHLTRNGIGRGDRVVVCLEPEANVPVALLAILKAGAIYVPVDPTYPPARIQVTLTDTKPRLVISRQALIDRLGLGPESGTFALDSEGRSLDRLSDRDLDTGLDAAQTATIFHTSGTTGRPKGVMASHANLAHYADVACRRYGMSSEDVVPAIARFTFSISIFELLAPLTVGATVVILDRDHVMDLPRLAATLREVTFFHAGPSLLNGLIAAIRAGGWMPGTYPRVRHASSGGDMVPPQLLSEMRDIFERAEIFVIYGCSEISCMGCTNEVPRQGPITRTFVGKPFDNTIVRVLDSERRPVPLGVAGEVYFAGPGVVTGYLDQSELGADRFVEIDGHRSYRTGDVGRVVEDGGLELLGRSDFQIKIRGMRVEAAEVEFHLRQVPGIRDGVVAGRDLRGEKVLVAFVVRDLSVAAAVPWDGPTLRSAVRSYLSIQVPDYMIPAVVVELPALPLNHNLKVDRNALPEVPSERSLDPGTSVRPPESPTEKTMARLWCELLDREAVGRDQNFFELGGHSLLAVQLMRRIEAELGVAVDGMTLLRESLHVVAGLCDIRLGRPGPSPGFADPPSDECRVETFYFGPEQALYGALYLPANSIVRCAVVICAPIGSDYARTSFVLTRLAKRLAARGTPALRFDYFGWRDSQGADFEGDPTRWKADILAARTEIMRRTGASEVMAVGVRLGGTLLLDTVETGGWTGLVLWDPVLDGSEYRAELERLHRRGLRALRALRSWRKPRTVAGRRELFGSTYSETALGEIVHLGVGRGGRGGRSLVPAVSWLASSEPTRQRAVFDSIATAGPGNRFEVAELEAEWDRIGDILPDVGLVETLVAMVEARG